MPVFNLCLKIIKKNLPSMSIYVGVFLVISTLIATLSTTTKQTGFSEAKTKIALIAEEETPLILGLKDELSKIADFVEVGDEREDLQDALFFRRVNYILRVPEGFTERFMAGEEVSLEKTIVPNAIANVYVDMKIEQYLNMARLYAGQNPGMHSETLWTYLAEDLDINTRVQIKAQEESATDRSYMMNYFNYLAYTFMSVVILGISAIMLVFNNLDVRRRNACAPIGAGKINLQFILANGVFTLACWVIMVGFCLVFDYKNISSTNTLYFVLNSFVFALCACGISFLVGNLAKGRESISAITNVITMGPCFISGVFVPQEFIGAGVLRIASFTPTYWYVRANGKIAEITRFNGSNLKDIVYCFMVELGFAVALFAIALVVGKRKRLENENA